MSMPAAFCLAITSATASATAAFSAAWSAVPFFSAISSSTTLAGRGRLPVWVVRILVVLRRMVLSPTTGTSNPERHGTARQRRAGGRKLGPCDGPNAQRGRSLWGGDHDHWQTPQPRRQYFII